MEDVDKRFSKGTKSEKLAFARAIEPYWYIPMQSINRPGLNERSDRDGIRNTYPSLIKYLDSRRTSANDQSGYRDYFCYRLAETYIMLAEAFALKGDYTNSAAALNIVRERAAWKEGEEKTPNFYKYPQRSVRPRGKYELYILSGTYRQAHKNLRYCRRRKP